MSNTDDNYRKFVSDFDALVQDFLKKQHESGSTRTANDLVEVMGECIGRVVYQVSVNSDNPPETMHAVLSEIIDITMAASLACVVDSITQNTDDQPVQNAPSTNTIQ
jgi:hypothetical protein